MKAKSLNIVRAKLGHSILLGGIKTIQPHYFHLSLCGLPTYNATKLCFISLYFNQHGHNNTNPHFGVVAKPLSQFLLVYFFVATWKDHTYNVYLHFPCGHAVHQQSHLHKICGLWVSHFTTFSSPSEVMVQLYQHAHYVIMVSPHIRKYSCCGMWSYHHIFVLIICHCHKTTRFYSIFCGLEDRCQLNKRPYLL